MISGNEDWQEPTEPNIDWAYLSASNENVQGAMIDDISSSDLEQLLAVGSRADQMHAYLKTLN